LAKRLALAQEFLQECNSFQEWRIFNQASKIQVAEQMTQVKLELGLKRVRTSPSAQQHNDFRNGPIMLSSDPGR
jgi:hypothetical protein